ncbi:hypothetical protein ARMGADRAFT_1040364 [Armillaria gallica]|uniref:Uncharacterized protein n=1 Tax=Armillaria gallica TaxID=47427 RepID=A0A2H3CDV0_ARMGA|nr:hypothetical protein ARMGADRAFT_1040364 [Armillaria gallica]
MDVRMTECEKKTLMFSLAFEKSARASVSEKDFDFGTLFQGIYTRTWYLKMWYHAAVKYAIFTKNHLHHLHSAQSNTDGAATSEGSCGSVEKVVYKDDRPYNYGAGSKNTYLETPVYKVFNGDREHGTYQSSHAGDATIDKGETTEIGKRRKQEWFLGRVRCASTAVAIGYHSIIGGPGGKL